VETNVTISSLLDYGVRVLIRTVKRIGKIAGETGAAGPHRPGSALQSQLSRERLNRS
jgi:IS5 family transposase